jgi:hypothetical protein
VAFGNQYPFATAKLHSSCATAKISSSVASSPGSPLGDLASWLGYGAPPKPAPAKKEPKAVEEEKMIV